MLRHLSAARTWWVRLAAVIALAVTVAGCAGGDDAEVEQAVSEATVDPEHGVLLTVTGAVGLVFGEQAFEVGVESEQNVLVVSPEHQVPVARGVTVRVTGVVEDFDLDAMEERGAELDEDRMRGFEGRSALIAVEVEVTSPDDEGIG